MMAVRIICTAQPGKPGGVSQYWTRLQAALEKAGVGVSWHGIGAWQKGSVGGDPERDIIIVDNHQATKIQPEYAVIAVQHGCAMEHGLRCKSKKHIAMGIEQARAAKRKRTFWVACSAWAANYCRIHMGVRADRIVFGGVDTDSFVPSERQRLRNASTPVIWHHCKDDNKGAGAIAAVAKQLGAGFEVRLLNEAPDHVPHAMREGDIWLCLSVSEGLPTVVMEAMATDLIVVSTNVGVMWPCTQGQPLYRAGFVGWLNRDVGAIVFDSQQRDYPKAVASHVGAAWQYRQGLRPREFARRWYGLDMFAQKWLEAIAAASKKLGVAV